MCGECLAKHYKQEELQRAIANKTAVTDGTVDSNTTDTALANVNEHQNSDNDNGRVDRVRVMVEASNAGSTNDPEMLLVQ